MQYIFEFGREKSMAEHISYQLEIYNNMTSNARYNRYENEKVKMRESFTGNS